MGRGWPRLAEAGRGWPRLAEAGRGWPRLEAALRVWSGAGGACQSWRAIGPKPQGGCFLLVRGEARVERLECVEHRLVGVGVDVDEGEAVGLSSEQVGE